MHEFGVSVIWLSLQVTIVAIVSALVYRFVRQRGPVLRSLVVASSMVMTLLLTVLALSPYPRWSDETSQESTIVNAQLVTTTDGEKSITPADAPLPQTQTANLQSVWGAAWGGFVEGLKKPQLSPSDISSTSTTYTEPLTWVSIVGYLFIIGAVAGLVRLLIGFILLKQELKYSTPLNNTSARKLLDELLAEHNCPSSIRLQETKRLATAAVIGWWRPVILLPHAWQTWSDNQLRAVMTHELAHILRGDFLSNLCAEVSRAVHFYHPLMHWLIAKLRLEQELAADATAAASSGGTTPYLKILAEMAIAQSNRTVIGPARPFLPTHNTFLRRIDMLKENQTFTGKLSRTARFVAVAIVMVAGLIAVGVRGERDAVAQKQATTVTQTDAVKKTTPQKRKPFRIDFVPKNTFAVVAIRPAEIYAEDLMKPIRKFLPQTDIGKLVKQTGVEFKDAEAVTALFLTSKIEPMSFAYLFQVDKPFDKKLVMKAYGDRAVKANYGEKTYIKQSMRKNAAALMFLDDRTLIVADGEQAMHDIISQLNGGGTNWYQKQWKTIEDESVAVMIDTSNVRAIMKDQQNRNAFPISPSKFFTGVVAPIAEHTNITTLGLKIDKSISLAATFYQEKDGEGVKKTLDALLTLSSNMLAVQKQNVQAPTPKLRSMLTSLISTGEKVLKTAKVTQKGEDVTLTAELPADSATQLVTLIVPAITASREAAQRTQSMNNLKQIALAMHNYHNKHKHFPPAVVMGPDGKTPHSWRVELLPFLEQQALYKLYRMNEPWDSKHNITISKIMVPVYHNPSGSNKTNSSYFVVVGKNTMFGNKEGVKIREVFDGTSNTILVVGAKRDIPWTKPEDIKYDGKTLPKFGGFHEDADGKNIYGAAYADGSVRLISETLNNKAVQKLLIINDENKAK